MLRALRHIRESRQSAQGRDGGFTLLELLIVLVIIPMIIGGVAAAVIAELDNTSQGDPHGTFVRLANAHDAQITSAYFVRDVQSSRYVSTDPSTPLCGSSDQLLGLSWVDGSTSVDVSYGVSSTTPLTLIRRYCEGTKPEVDSTLSHQVFPPSLSAVTLTNSACPPGISACALSGVTPYLTVTVNCVNGSKTCANGGSVPVVKPTIGAGGISSVTLSVFENQTTNYQYTLTGVPRLSNTISQGNPESGPPGSTFISNGPVSNGSCSSLVNGLAIINDSSGTALSVGGSDKAYFNATGYYTSGGSVPSGDPVTTGPPIPSPYDWLTEPPSSVVVSQINGSTSPVASGTSITSVQLPDLILPVTSDQSVVLSNGTQTIDLPVTDGPYRVSSTPTTITVSSTKATGTYSPGSATAYAAYVEPSANPTTDGLDLSKTLPSGIYLWQNGISLSGNHGFDGSAGVLFYVTGGSVSLSGNGQTNLVPLNPNWEVTPQASVIAINNSTSAVANGATISSVTLASVPMPIAPGYTIVLSNGTRSLDMKATTGAAVGSTPTTISVVSTGTGPAAANASYTPGSARVYAQPLPEVVLWISRSDTSPNNPPRLLLDGGAGTITLQGAIYAPTAQTTIKGGGNASGPSVSAQALVVGGVTCSGGGAGIDLSAGSQLTSGTVGLPNSGLTTASVTNHGQSIADKVTVTGVGHLAPTGYAWVYVCGPYPVEPSVDPACTSSASGVQSVAVGRSSVGLTPNSTTGTSTATSSASVPFTPTQAGYYCFASYYSGDQSANDDPSPSYDPSYDTTTDGCFQVSPVLAISQPVSGDCYASSPTPLCPNTWPGALSGTADDTAGPGLKQLTLTIKGPNGLYWNGKAFLSTSSAPQNISLSGTHATWSYSFPTSDFLTEAVQVGTYTVTAHVTDTGNASSQTTQLSFTWDG